MSTYYIDIDNTITTTPDDGVKTSYNQAEPIQERIERINKLYDDGHTIIYWTARGTISSINHRDLTEMQLNAWGVKYHELKFEKPAFDFMIDDKAYNANEFFVPKKIGFVVNNLIRNYIEKLGEVYTKYTTTKKELEEGKLNLPIEPINPYELETSFPLKDDEFSNIYELLYYGIPLEVFGGANQTSTNYLQRLSNFKTKINDEILILSRETNRSKIATLSFLAKCQYDFKQLNFVDSYEEYWDYVDILITDNPEIIKVKPEGKTVVVYKNDYNTVYHNEKYTIEKPEDVFELPIFDLKPIKEEELIHITKDVPEGLEEDKLEIQDQQTVEDTKIIGTFSEEETVKLDLGEIRKTEDEEESKKE